MDEHKKILFCGQCGEKIPEGHAFCSSCGYRVRDTAASVAPVSVAPILEESTPQEPSVPEHTEAPVYVAAEPDAPVTPQPAAPVYTAPVYTAPAQAPQAPAEKPKKKRKWWIPVIICTVLLLLIAAGLVLFKLFHVESIELSQSELDLLVEEEFTLTYTIEPSSAEDTEVKWSSSDKSVAVVSKNGKVTAIGAGECTITVKAQGEEATCEVTVIDVESLELSADTLSLMIDTEAELTCTIEPKEAKKATVEWSSSDKDVATVSKHGKVTAVGDGTCTITAKIQDITATCTVNVYHVESIACDRFDLELVVDETQQLSYVILPAEASDVAVTWTSSDESVATVSKDGTVTAVGPGTCTITADCCGKTATCSVEVSQLTKEEQQILGRWSLEGIMADGDYTEAYGLITLTLNDDFTGTFQSYNNSLYYTLTWHYSKPSDTSSMLYFDVTIDGTSTLMGYTAYDDELLLLVGDSGFFFSR